MPSHSVLCLADRTDRMGRRRRHAAPCETKIEQACQRVFSAGEIRWIMHNSKQVSSYERFTLGADLYQAVELRKDVQVVHAPGGRLPLEPGKPEGGALQLVPYGQEMFKVKDAPMGLRGGVQTPPRPAWHSPTPSPDRRSRRAGRHRARQPRPQAG